MFGRQWERRFEWHDLRGPILRLLAERPRSGYELAQAAAEEARGRYGADPAAVYPTLQLLEDLGYVTVTADGGKRLYSITEDGRRYLAERERAAPDYSDPAVWWTIASDRDRHPLFRELGEFAWLVGKEVGLGRHDAATLERVRAVIAAARREVERILAGEPRGTGTGAGPVASSAPPYSL